MFCRISWIFLEDIGLVDGEEVLEELSSSILGNCWESVASKIVGKEDGMLLVDWDDILCGDKVLSIVLSDDVSLF